MKQTVVTKLGAGCGALFAVVLTVANGDGSNAFSTPRAVAGVAALTLALPFVSIFVAVTAAAGTTAPEGSVTVPASAPWLLVCDQHGDASRNNAQRIMAVREPMASSSRAAAPTTSA